MSKHSNIRALTFDVFGTVVDWRNSIADEAREILGRGHGIDLDWHDFANAWRAKYQPAMQKVRDGSRPFVKLDVLHWENLLELMADLELNDVPESSLQQLNLAWHRLRPWPDSVAGLSQMKQRRILATLSNGNIALIVDMAKNAGLPWDVVLGAEVARAFKPQPEAYLAAADALSLKPSQCMMVAAHNADLVQASKIGFRTAFVLRADEYGPGHTVDQRAEHDFDIVANNFVELAEMLES
jgi:2-haloacid dehalogenase